MKDWFEDRSQREQMLLLAAAVFSALVVLWVGLVAPVMRANEEAHLAYERSARTADLVELGVSQVLAARVEGPTEVTATRLSSDQVRAKVISAAQATGLAPTQLRNETDGSVSAVFRETDSRLLFAFLQLLATREGVTPRTASITRAQEGLVSASFEFVGNGA